MSKTEVDRVEEQAPQSETLLVHLKGLLVALRKVTQLILQEKDRDRLLKRVCEILVEGTAFQDVWLVLVENGVPVEPFFYAGTNGHFELMAEQLRRGGLPDCAKRALSAPEVVVVDDPPAQCGDCPLSQTYAGCMVFPMRLEHAGRVFGWLNVSVDSSLGWNEEGRDCFAEVGNHVAFSLWSIEREAQRQSLEMRYGAVLATTGDAVISADMKGRITTFNDGAAQLLGCPASEALGQQVALFCPDDLLDEQRKLLRRMLETGLVPAHETERLTRDGRRVPVEITMTLRTDEQGRVVGTTGILRNISERKAAQRAVKESTDHVQEILDNTRIQMWAFNGEIYSYVNAEWYAYTHQDRSQDLTPEVWTSMVHPDDLAEAGATWMHHWEAKTEHDNYFRLRRFDGVYRDFFCHAVPMFDDEGRFRHFQGYNIDITDRKRAEQALRESEERLHVVFDSSADYLMLLDLEHKVQMINRVEQGLTREAVIGTPLYTLAGPHEAQVKGCLDRVVGEVGLEQWDTVYSRPDGGEVTFSSMGAPIIVSGEVTGSVVSSRDISDRVKLEAEKRKIEATSQQSRKMEAIGRLAGGVAHDFNNLLTIINSYAELATTNLRDGDPLKSDLEQILTAGQRAAGLTRQLLAFGRKQVMEPRVLDLNEVVGDMDRMLSRLIGEDIEFSTMLAEGLGHVTADPSQVEQVLMNLVVNARDAMPRGGKLTIETANVELGEEYAKKHPDTAVGSYVMLAVTDTGAGMSEEVRRQIFDPFYTTKEMGQGTGLGLATVYGIVKQSRGNIWVYSELGEGTVFKVYLPRIEAEKTKALNKVDTGDLRGHETILVVEDEDAVRELAERILSSAGYEVLTAANGGEALLQCEQHGSEMDLVLTDVVMPKMSGKELANRLSEVCPALKVLYMSGYTENTIIQHGVLDEGTHFIAKPFNSPELLEKIRVVLESENSTKAPRG
ncbi:MAG: PAS domain S-box protein [Deltaproteobacteria bacterium]|nr:PAS domain S-box protein [Deltaproteobacteria bacterium]